MERRDDGEAERRRSSSSPALWSGLLGCGNLKLGMSVSTSGWRRCCWSTGLQVGGGGGGCRRRAGATAELRQGVALGKKESVGSSGTYFKSRKRHGERELLLASRRHAWRLGRWQRDVEEHGEG
jgi:hypothetical protein